MTSIVENTVYNMKMFTDVEKKGYLHIFGFYKNII